MPNLSKTEARALIEKALESMLDPEAPVEELSEFFSPDYKQDADGATLDFTDFLAHARDLKSTISSGSVTFETMIVDGPTIADIHIVSATKINGDKVCVKVIAFYTVEHGKITRVDELTHLLSGSAEDRNLGSRMSH